MKLRPEAYSVIGTILLVVVGILAVANIRPMHDQCAWQFPKLLSCLLSTRETLAAGLIGAGGAIFAAWLAWTAVQRQIAEGKVAQKRGVVSTLEHALQALRAAQDDLRDLVGRFPLDEDSRQLSSHAFASILFGMHPAGFRSVQMARSAPDGLGERVWNRLDGLRMTAALIYGKINSLSADTKGPILAGREAEVRSAVTAARELLVDVEYATPVYEQRLTSAQQELEASDWEPDSLMTLKQRAEFWNAQAMLAGGRPVWWQRAIIKILLGIRYDSRLEVFRGGTKGNRPG
jgi:hypothetical protein